MNGDQSLLSAAAAGDVEAQRQCVQLALDMVKTGQCNPILGYNSLLIWARIAAAHGLAQDRHMLAGCLCGLANVMEQAGHGDLATSCVAEALLLLEALADEGSELGAHCVNQLIENLPPHVTAAAKMMKETA